MPKDFASSWKSGLYGVPSGLVNSVPYVFLKYVVPTLRIVEKQKLLNNTQSTGMSSSTAVVKAPTTDIKPPSPTRPTTFRSGAPSLAPIAAAGEKPIVANPPLVMNDPGCNDGSCWPAPFLFQPTSVTAITSGGRTRPNSASKRAGW